MFRSCRTLSWQVICVFPSFRAGTCPDSSSNLSMTATFHIHKIPQFNAHITPTQQMKASLNKEFLSRLIVCPPLASCNVTSVRLATASDYITLCLSYRLKAVLVIWLHYGPAYCLTKCQVSTQPRKNLASQIQSGKHKPVNLDSSECYPLISVSMSHVTSFPRPQ